MCTILFSYKQQDRPALLLLANRDEFYERPTRAADRWEDHPGILAGRDLVGGGTWLGVNDSGKLAAVTNYRDPDQARGSRSRGALVADFLKSEQGPQEYLESVKREQDFYTGFNLIAGQFGDGGSRLLYFSNRGGGILKLGPGSYGLSNHLLDTPWPKVVRGKERLDALMSRDAEDDTFFELLSDRTPAKDGDLPDTGIGYKKEKLLSSIFIETPIYGTRSSTLVRWTEEKGFELKERVWV